MKQFLVFVVIALLSGCANFDGLERDWNAVKSSLAQRDVKKTNAVVVMDKAVERKCRALYIVPGRADPIDRSAVVSCYSVEIFNAMSENRAFREYVAMDCRVRNGKRSEKCGDAESVAIERSWYLRNREDSRYYGHAQPKKRR